MSVVHATSHHANSGHHRQTNIREAAGEFDRLFQSLQAGTLSSAKDAYAALDQLAGGSATADSPVNEILADWEALGKALGAGDTAAAKSAFAELKGDLEAAVKARSTDSGDALDRARSVYSAMQSVEGGSGAHGHHGSHHTHHGAHHEHGGHHAHGGAVSPVMQFVPVAPLVPVGYVAVPMQYAAVRYA